MKHDHTYVRSIALFGLKEFFEGYGQDIKAMLLEVGIEPAMLDSDSHFYSCHKGNKLWDIAAERLNDPDVGLKYVLSLGPHYSNVGPLLFLAQFERNHRDWLTSYKRYLRYHTNGARLDSFVDTTNELVVGRVHYDPLIQTGRQVEDINSFLAVQLVRMVLNDESLNPAYVRFKYPRPDDWSLHKEVFRCPIEFGCRHSEMAYPAGLLDHPIGSRWRFMKPVVDFFVRTIGNRDIRGLGSTSQRVRTAIPVFFGTGRCNLDAVANTLEMHPKTLQRELSGEGETFSSLLEQVKEATARQLVSSSNLPLSEIASFLDYAGLAPFSLAFKRWTQTTPGRYRKEERESAKKLNAVA